MSRQMSEHGWRRDKDNESSNADEKTKIDELFAFVCVEVRAQMKSITIIFARVVLNLERCGHGCNLQDERGHKPALSRRSRALLQNWQQARLVVEFRWTRG